MGFSLKMASIVEPAESGEAEGCVQCQIGSKLVLFVTGNCHWACDYCPLSETRRDIDIMYANERPCTNFDQVLEEAKAMNATGTGITGGDPLMARERSLEAIMRLKSEFGPSHHIHMYTSIPFNPEYATAFAEAGLDEIRFHLLKLELEKYIPTIKACSDAGIFTGIELPAEPDKESRLYELIEELRNVPISFLNLNELEITVGNYDNMELRGFNISNEITAGADGSSELATNLKNRVSNANAGLKDLQSGQIHESYGFHLKFCTSSYKDAGQLRSRFRRRAESTIRPYEQLSDDDTLVFGGMYIAESDADSFISDISSNLEISDNWLMWNSDEARIEMPLSVAEYLAKEVEYPIAMIEVHPTHDRLEVCLVWLNNSRE